MRSQLLGIGLAGQAAPVPVGAPDQKDEVEGRIGGVGQSALLAGVEFLELLGLLEIVQLFERGVGVGFDAPPLQVAGDLLFQHVGQVEDAHDPGIAAHQRPHPVGYIHKHPAARAAAQTADDVDELVVAHHRKAPVLGHFVVADFVQSRVLCL